MSLNLPECVLHPLLLVQSRGDLFGAETARRLGEAFHLDQSVGEIAILEEKNNVRNATVRLECN